MARQLGAAAKLAEKDYGGGLVTDETSKQPALGTSNILSGDPERVITVLYNLSASAVYAGFTGSVGTFSGMLIPPNGGFLLINAVEDYEVATLPLFIYTPVANPDLYIMTTRRESGPVEGS